MLPQKVRYATEPTAHPTENGGVHSPAGKYINFIGRSTPNRVILKDTNTTQPPSMAAKPPKLVDLPLN